jgi:hypothetical protein
MMRPGQELTSSACLSVFQSPKRQRRVGSANAARCGEEARRWRLGL